MSLPNDTFDIIYADPPWFYNNRTTHNKGKSTGGASSHYPVMTLKQLKELDVKRVARDNSLLFMWTSSPHLDQAIKLGMAWGFAYKTVAFVWHKQSVLVGHYTLSECELCLVFKRGAIPKPRGACNERQFLLEKRTKRHSEKPHEIRERITRMFPTQKKIELFARHQVEGWESWGNE